MARWTESCVTYRNLTLRSGPSDLSRLRSRADLEIGIAGGKKSKISISNPILYHICRCGNVNFKIRESCNKCGVSMEEAQDETLR